MGKIKTKLLSLALVVVMLISPLPGNLGSSEAQAATLKASTLDQLVSIIREQTMKRSASFTVKFTGSDDVIDYVMGDDFRLFYYDLAKLDDPNTSDDADYIVGNLDFTNGCDIGFEDDSFTFNLVYFETAKQTTYVNNKVESILDSLGVANMTDYGKVKAIHDYVCKIITYTLDCSSVYNAFSSGKGLCNSYALCMCKLLTEAGIPCKWIGGSAGTGRDADGHAWNIVKLNGKWYYLDATWDDLDDEKSWNYDYFLKGSSDFDSADPSQKHTLDTEYTTTNYLKDFPLAKTAYVPTKDDLATGSNNNNSNNNNSNNDDNYNDSDEYDDCDNDYDDEDDEDYDDEEIDLYDLTIEDVIEGYYPENDKLTIKRKKTDDIQMYVAYEDAVESITYKVTKGKNYITVTDCGMNEDEDGYSFYDLEVKGKKAGNAKIRVTVKLINGEKESFDFTVKVKK